MICAEWAGSTHIVKGRWRRANHLALAALVAAALAVMGCRSAVANGGGKAEPRALELVQKSDCLSCHQMGSDLVGPAWDKVAERYGGKPGMVSVIAEKIRKGSVGVWGKLAMPPHPNLSEADAQEMARWILSLKPRKKKASRTYTYKTADGKAVTVDFPVFISDKERKVTDSIFRGYELYNSYCFRCHGFDAVGGEYAPDLRASVNNGLTRKKFFIATMQGRKEKGMPAWAGFFDAAELQKIYEYVKARALGLVGPGRPPSTSD